MVVSKEVEKSVRGGGERAVYEMEAPGTVFQTVLVEGGKQDGSAPLTLSVAVSEGTARALAPRGASAAVDVSERVFASIRRVDGRPVEVWEEGMLQSLRVPAAMCSAQLEGRVLTVHIKRKHLPVSKNHGDAPFLLLFALRDARGAVVALVRTTPFFIASKQKPASRLPRALPKRLRGPPLAKPLPGPPPPEESAIDSLFSAEAALATAAASDASPTVSAPADGAAAGSKRARHAADEDEREVGEEDEEEDGEEDSVERPRRRARVDGAHPPHATSSFTTTAGSHRSVCPSPAFSLFGHLELEEGNEADYVVVPLAGASLPDGHVHQLARLRRGLTELDDDDF
jgi:hypothetical protein